MVNERRRRCCGGPARLEGGIMAMNVLGENIGPAPDARRGKPFKDVVAQLREDCGVAPLTTVNGHNGGPTTCGVQPADVQSAAADAPANGGTPEEPDAAGYRSEERRVGKECRSRWS